MSERRPGAKHYETPRTLKTFELRTLNNTPSDVGAVKVGILPRMDVSKRKHPPFCYGLIRWYRNLFICGIAKGRTKKVKAFFFWYDGYINALG